jgi:DNA primase
MSDKPGSQQTRIWSGGEMPVETLDELERQISLLDYLQAHDWRPARRLSRGRWMGMCPLRREHNPSFVVGPNKELFYCHGCGRGEHLR